MCGLLMTRQGAVVPCEVQRARARWAAGQHAHGNVASSPEHAGRGSNARGSTPRVSQGRTFATSARATLQVAEVGSVIVRHLETSPPTRTRAGCSKRGGPREGPRVVRFACGEYGRRGPRAMPADGSRPCLFHFAAVHADDEVFRLDGVQRVASAPGLVTRDDRGPVAFTPRGEKPRGRTMRSRRSEDGVVKRLLPMIMSQGGSPFGDAPRVSDHGNQRARKTRTRWFGWQKSVAAHAMPTSREGRRLNPRAVSLLR